MPTELSVDDVFKQKFTERGLKRIANKSNLDFDVRYFSSQTLHYGKQSVHKRRRVAKAKKSGAVRVTTKKASVQITGKKPKFYEAVKAEFVEILCGKHKRYAKLRKMASTYSNESQAAVVGAISAVIGAQIGVAAVLIAPILAIFLLAFLQVGKNAFCAGRVS